MIDKTEKEKEQIRQGLKYVAEVISADIGFEKRLCDLTETQMLTLVEAAVDGFNGS